MRAKSIVIQRLKACSLVATLALVTPGSAAGQGFLEKMTKAAQGLAGAAGEAAMLNSTAIDIESMGLPTLAIGPLTAGISHVDIKDNVGVRLHVYLYNPTDEPVSVTVPKGESFVLIDSRGRRLQFLNLRVKNLAKGSEQLVIPALERVSMGVLYKLDAPDQAGGTLKVGAGGIIRGVPLSLGANGSSPAPTEGSGSGNPSPSETPQKDSLSAVVSRNQSRR